MKYFFSLLLVFSFALNTNAQSTETRTERAERLQMESAEKLSVQNYETSLARYEEAVKVLDKESQDAIRKSLILEMEQIVEVSKYNARKSAKTTNATATKTKISKQEQAIKILRKSNDVEEIKTAIAEFGETLK